MLRRSHAKSIHPPWVAFSLRFSVRRAQSQQISSFVLQPRRRQSAGAVVDAAVLL